VNVVNEVVRPCTTGVLVETHRPVGNDLDVGVGVQFGQIQQVLLWYTTELGYVVQVVACDEFLVFFEINRARTTSLGCVDCFLLAWVFRPEPVSDVLVTFDEVHMLANEVRVDPVGLDDVVSDEVQDGQVSLWFEDHAVVGQVETPMLEG